MDNTVTTNEDTRYTFKEDDFKFSDPSDTPPNNFAAVKITTIPAAGVLKLNELPVTPGQIVLVADIVAGKLTYDPAANANGNPYSEFTFQVQDDGDGLLPNVNMDQSPNTMTINVTPVNDAPEASDSSVTTLEDIAYAFNKDDFHFSDPLDAPPNNFKAVEITTLPLNGTLNLDGTTVFVGQIVQVADLPKLKFWPAANANGNPYASFKFRVQDDGGTANGGQDWCSVVDPYTMTIVVTSVNDAPVGTDNTVTTAEDVAYKFAVADFGFTDPLDNPPNNFDRVKITTIPAAGVLKLNGNPVTAGQIVPVSAIAAGQLQYTPTLNLFGSPFTHFTFQVGDDGGTANSGVDMDQSPRIMTINVTSINDSPMPFDDSTRIQEGSVLAITANLLALNDSPGPANESGQLPLTVIDVFGDANAHGTVEIVDGTITFTPNPNYNGPAVFYYLVQDNGPIDDPTIRHEHGKDLKSNQAWGRVFVTIGETNDAPIPVDDVVYTPMNTPISIAKTLLTSNDSAGPYEAEQSLTVLSVFGNSTTQGTISVVNGDVIFTPFSGFSGTTTFWYVVQDNGTTNGFLDPKQATGVVHVVVDNSHIWSGLGLTNRWSEAANWVGGVPGSGDNIVFPAGAAKLENINDIASTSVFGSIIMDAGGGYHITNLNGLNSSSSIEVRGNSTLSVTSIVANTLVIGGSGGNAATSTPAVPEVTETYTFPSVEASAVVVSEVAPEAASQPAAASSLPTASPIQNETEVAVACLPVSVPVAPPTVPAAEAEVDSLDLTAPINEIAVATSIAAPAPWNPSEPAIPLVVAQELVKIDPIPFLPSILHEQSVVVEMKLSDFRQTQPVAESVPTIDRAKLPANAAAARDAVFQNLASPEKAEDAWTSDLQLAKHRSKNPVDFAFQEDDEFFALDVI
jgi:hypothetical protein